MTGNLANARTLIIAAAATFAAVVWWATRGPGEALQVAASSASTQPAGGTPGRPATGGASTTAATTPAPALDEDAAAAEASFRTYVTDKYRYLFRGSPLEPGAKAALQDALLERERIAVQIRTASQSTVDAEREGIPPLQAQLAAAERKIALLLPPNAITPFEVLKDSELEQFQLEDYAGGISNIAPVSDDDKYSILMTKLTARQHYRSVLDQSGLLRGELTREERKLAFAQVSRALKSAKDNYLREVRQYLFNDEQFQLLSNYENTEFTTELEKLHKIAYGD